MSLEKSTIQAIFSEVKALNDTERKAQISSPAAGGSARPSFIRDQKRTSTDSTVLNTILDDVDPLLHTKRAKRGNFFQNRLQKVSLYGALSLFGAGIICVGLFLLLPVPQIRWLWWAYFAELFMVFSCLGIGVSVFAFGAIPVIQSIYHPEKVLREAILTPVKEELDRIIAQLIAKYEQGQLEYALERVTFGAAQKRLQNALTIGALDKVGLLPLLIGTGISLIALWKEPLFSANLFLVSGIAGGVVLVYLAAISQQRALLRLDTVALALKHAVAAKKLSSEDRGPNPTSLLPRAQ